MSEISEINTVEFSLSLDGEEHFVSANVETYWKPDEYSFNIHGVEKVHPEWTFIGHYLLSFHISNLSNEVDYLDEKQKKNFDKKTRRVWDTVNYELINQMEEMVSSRSIDPPDFHWFSCKGEE